MVILHATMVNIGGVIFNFIEKVKLRQKFKQNHKIMKIKFIAFFNIKQISLYVWSNYLFHTNIL